MAIQITDVKVNLLKNPSKVKAFASITLSGELVISNYKVLEGNNGLFVGNPSEKREEGYKDTVFPITADSRKYIQDTILEAYKAKVGATDAPEAFQDDNPF